jgi:hypothetical protein
MGVRITENKAFEKGSGLDEGTELFKVTLGKYFRGGWNVNLKGSEIGGGEVILKNV